MENGDLKHEMTLLGTNVLRISEMRWRGEDDYESDGCRMILWGREESQRGVAIINNITQKNSQLGIKGPVSGWQTVDGEVKRETTRHVHHEVTYSDSGT